MGRTVLLGTPNQGRLRADRFRGNWLLEFLNTPVQELGTQGASFPLSLEDPYYLLGVIAGKMESCIADSIIQGSNDGLVTVASTVVNNMSDLLVVNVGHSTMRYD